MKPHRTILRFACFFVLALAAAASPNDAPQIFPAPCFTDDMVLQSPSTAPGDAPLIWGWADKNLTVFVRIGSVGLPIRAQPWEEVPGQDPLKAWVVRYRMLGASPLPPQGPFDIAISGRKRKLEVSGGTLHNVVAGDVWLVVDPEFAIKPSDALPSTATSGDVRVLMLNTGNFEVKPVYANSLAAGKWQILGDPQSRLANQWAVSAYYLNALRFKPRQEPIGVLLISRAKWLGYSQYLAEHDFLGLPTKDQTDPQFTQAWAIWNSAWWRAGDEWKAVRANYEASLVPLKRQGKIPDSPPPKDPLLGHPSIGADNPPQLKYAIRGTLH